ncbi:hypothetical protein [Streptomyces rimosus]|uniref:hypothetical protein n=1 Tax=Streptomyces rimosus TaxID=1927 RepID=UPI0004BF635D|nr:hypothetical protein [Streptomyces rimosus]
MNANDTIDLIGEIHPWLARYDALAARHAANLAPYLNEDGDVLDSEYPRYDEKRFDNLTEADEFLDSLAACLRELVGPPVPGNAFTLTFAGPERHDGEKPYAFVVNGSDLPDAGRTLLHLPSFREWFAEQAGWDDTPPDVLYLAEESHPGIPEYGYFNDLRREQAASPECGSAPELPPVPQLLLT